MSVMRSREILAEEAFEPRRLARTEIFVMLIDGELHYAEDNGHAWWTREINGVEDLRELHAWLRKSHTGDYDRAMESLIAKYEAAGQPGTARAVQEGGA